MKITHTIMNGPFAFELANHFNDQRVDNAIYVIGCEDKRWNLPEAHYLPDFAHETLISLNTEVESSEIWIIHRFYPEFREMIQWHMPTTLIVTQTWGPDYLKYFKDPNSFLEYETLTFLKKNPPEKAPFSLKAPYRAWRKRRVLNTGLDTLQSLDAVLFCLPNEASIARAEIGVNSVECRFMYNHRWNYNPIERDKTNICIQVGHCSDPTMNHLDVLLQLQVNPQVEKVLIPISYGVGTLNYRNEIKMRAALLQCKSTEILDSYLSLEAYEEKCEEYDVIVLACKRQQALGNLIHAILRGKHIVLHPEGLLAAFCSKIGIKFTNLFDLGSLSPVDLISSEDASKNFKQLASYWHESTNRDCISFLIERYSEKFQMKRTESYPHLD